MNSPLISVIIPAFNSGKYLRKAVESVLNQTVLINQKVRLEILILDDASNDSTNMAAEKLCAQHHQIKYFRNQENLGAAETRNRGFTLAEGEYMAFLDADDIWLESKLERQLSLMEGRNLDVCYTGYSFINYQGIPFGKPYRVPENLSLKRLINENVIGCSTVLARKSAIQGLQMRKEYAHEDYVFWMELMQKGRRFGGIKEPLSLYRMAKNSRSNNKMKSALARWRIYRDFLKLNVFSATASFISYAVRGFRKYYL